MLTVYTFHKINSNTSTAPKNSVISQAKLDENWYNWAELNQIAWYAYEAKVSDTNLSLAMKAINRSISLNKNYYNLDTKSALLYLKKDYTQALKLARSAILLAKTNNINYNDTSDLILKIIRGM